MFARVSTYRGETERLLDGFRRTTEPLTQLEGVRARLLPDRLRGRSGGDRHAVGLAGRAGGERGRGASKAREHAAHESGAAVESVRSYEVAHTAEKPALR
jgi:hypothetical protein